MHDTPKPRIPGEWTPERRSAAEGPFVVVLRAAIILVLALAALAAVAGGGWLGALLAAPWAAVVLALAFGKSRSP